MFGLLGVNVNETVGELMINANTFPIFIWSYHVVILTTLCGGSVLRWMREWTFLHHYLSYFIFDETVTSLASQTESNYCIPLCKKGIVTPICLEEKGDERKMPYGLWGHKFPSNKMCTVDSEVSGGIRWVCVPEKFDNWIWGVTETADFSFLRSWSRNQ